MFKKIVVDIIGTFTILADKDEICGPKILEGILPNTLFLSVEAAIASTFQEV